nr:MAG TPA: hypothetical protein [Caudoviricetes sp.]
MQEICLSLLPAGLALFSFLSVCPKAESNHKESFPLSYLLSTPIIILYISKVNRFLKFFLKFLKFICII